MAPRCCGSLLNSLFAPIFKETFDTSSDHTCCRPAPELLESRRKRTTPHRHAHTTNQQHPPHHTEMEEAAARRERLKALKAAAQLSGDAPDAGAAAAAAEQEPEKPTLKFRNYVVKDTRIEHEQVCVWPACAAAKACRGHSLLCGSCRCCSSATPHSTPDCAHPLNHTLQVAPAQVPTVEEPVVEQRPEDADEEVRTGGASVTAARACKAFLYPAVWG